MTLTAELRRRVAWILKGHLEDDNPDTFEARARQQLARLSTPQEWYLWASESHPAQSVAEWRSVLDSPLCDQGTALLVYWRNSPVFFHGDEPAGGWDQYREEIALLREVERRTAAGDWPSAVVRFDPAAFQGFSFLSGEPSEVLARVPEIMLRPSPGVPVPPLAATDFDWSNGVV